MRCWLARIFFWFAMISLCMARVASLGIDVLLSRGVRLFQVGRHSDLPSKSFCLTRCETVAEFLGCSRVGIAETLRRASARSCLTQGSPGSQRLATGRAGPR